MILVFNVLIQQPTPDEIMNISSPLPGDAIQGVCAITGKVKSDEIKSYEVSFAYQKDQGGNWFLIARGNQPDSNGTFAFWDTNRIADGIYRIRIMAIKRDGQMVELFIPNIRVRNYSPIETETPTPVSGSALRDTATPVPSFTPKAINPTATDFPINPLVITDNQIAGSMILGFGGGILFLLTLAVLYLTKSR